MTTLDAGYSRNKHELNAGSAKRLVQEFLPTGPGSPPASPAIPGADKDKALACVLASSVGNHGYSIHYTTKTTMDELDAKLARNKVIWTGCFEEGFQLAKTNDQQVFVQQAFESGFKHVWVLAYQTRNLTLASKDYQHVLTHFFGHLKDGGDASSLVQQVGRVCGIRTHLVREKQIGVQLANCLLACEDKSQYLVEVEYERIVLGSLSQEKGPVDSHRLLKVEGMKFAPDFSALMASYARTHGKIMDKKLQTLHIVEDSDDEHVVRVPKRQRRETSSSAITEECQLCGDTFRRTAYIKEDQVNCIACQRVVNNIRAKLIGLDFQVTEQEAMYIVWTYRSAEAVSIKALDTPDGASKIAHWFAEGASARCRACKWPVASHGRICPERARSADVHLCDTCDELLGEVKQADFAVALNTKQLTKCNFSELVPQYWDACQLLTAQGVHRGKRDNIDMESLKRFMNEGHRSSKAAKAATHTGVYLELFQMNAIVSKQFQYWTNWTNLAGF